MDSLPDELRDVILRAAPRLRALPPAAAARPPAPGKWSPKQVLGHLIDSAANNHGRFVRSSGRADLCFEGYDQEAWVRVQRHGAADWALLVTLWEAYNLHLAWVLAGLPREELERPRQRHALADIAWEVVPADEPVSLAYLARDYLGHLCHHLRQIDPELAPEPRLQRAAPTAAPGDTRPAREKQPVRIRELAPAERPAWLRMRERLWPAISREELSREQDAILADREKNAVLVAESPGGGRELAGLVEVSLRPWAEGCTSSPVGYIEAWYVEPAHRRTGIGRALIAAAERWVESRGCAEVGSDADLDNDVSHRAHGALGYAEIGRLVLFSKRLAR